MAEDKPSHFPIHLLLAVTTSCDQQRQQDKRYHKETKLMGVVWLLR